jgi:hypothetical protein
MNGDEGWVGAGGLRNGMHLARQATMVNNPAHHRPGDPVDWHTVYAALDRASGDYHWYSPILTEKLRGKLAM